MKKIVFILSLSFIFLQGNAQTDTSEVLHQANTPVRRVVRTKKLRIVDTVKRASTTDTLPKVKALPIVDSTALQADTALKSAIVDSVVRVTTLIPAKHLIDSIYLHLLDNPFFRTKLRPVYLVISEKQRQSKDEMFYLLSGLLFLLALVKLSFSKYFVGIFRQFIQLSFRQKQSRDQLSQNNFPSLVLNLFFIVSGGAFVALLMQYYNLSEADFKTNFLYSSFFLLILYIGKFILLSFAGWVFNEKDATETYIFIVFLVNKIMGIILLPFSFIIAFSKPGIITAGVTVSLMLVSGLFGYRYIAGLMPVRREMKVSATHFLFYILAFEIMPLLLIYKTMENYLAKSV